MVPGLCCHVLHLLSSETVWRRFYKKCREVVWGAFQGNATQKSRCIVHHALSVVLCCTYIPTCSLYFSYLFTLNQCGAKTDGLLDVGIQPQFLLGPDTLHINLSFMCTPSASLTSTLHTISVWFSFANLDTSTPFHSHLASLHLRFPSVHNLHTIWLAQPSLV